MNKEVACRKIMKITNRTHIQNIGKYLDIVKNKWFSTMKDMYKMERLYRNIQGLIGN